MATAVRLGWAFGADREHGFTAWTLATPDPLAAVLAPGYFRHCTTRFRAGDLVFCATGQPGTGPRVPCDAEPDRHRCLLLVTRIGAGEVEVRVAQDWGSPMAAPMVASVVAQAKRSEVVLADASDAAPLPGRTRPAGKRKLGLRDLAGAGAVRRRPRPAGMAVADLATAGRARAGARP
jgi:hypothetical protein